MVPLWLSLKALAVLFDATKGLFGIDRNFSRTLDATAGDVVTYVRSRRPIHPTSSAAAEICARFYDTVQRATERCDEVHVVAHSLGTVVAYDAVTGATLDTIAEEEVEERSEQLFRKLQRLYTFGSPLEKVLFFWPMLVRRAPVGRVIHQDSAVVSAPQRDETSTLPDTFEWHNFYHQADLVSNRLTHFEHLGKLTNHRVTDFAGVVTSHTSYYSAPLVHLVLGTELLSLTPKQVGSWARLKHRAAQIVENGAASIVVVSILAASALAFFVLVPLIFCMLADLELTRANMTKAGLAWLSFWIAFGIWYFRSGWRTAISLHQSYTGDERST